MGIFSSKGDGKEVILGLPLVKNVPDGHPGWIRTTCPDCGQACWQLIDDKKAEFLGVTKKLCTECAVRYAESHGGESDGSKVQEVNDDYQESLNSWNRMKKRLDKATADVHIRIKGHRAKSDIEGDLTGLLSAATLVVNHITEETGASAEEVINTLRDLVNITEVTEGEED